MDYSKWDRFVEELSDEEEESLEQPEYYDLNGKKNSMVSKLSSPGRVTIGPNGPVIEPLEPCRNTNCKTVDNNQCSNGYSTDSYCWGQSKDEVIVRVFVPLGTKARNIKVDFDSREANKRLTIWNQTNCIFDKLLSYSVDLDPDIGVEWEIKDNAIELTFQKATIVKNAVHWWDSAFIGEEKLDVTKISDRKSLDSGNLWEEAHRLFRERIATRKHVDIDDEKPDIDLDVKEKIDMKLDKNV